MTHRSSRREFVHRAAIMAGAAVGTQYLPWPRVLADSTPGAASDAIAAAAPGAESQPFDLAPFGLHYRADLPPEQNPAETQWLTDGKADTLAGIMWEEHRPVREIEVTFAEPIPDLSQLILEVTTNTPTAKQDNRPTWWSRQYESFPGAASKSTDGRQVVFRTDRDLVVQRLSQYPPSFQFQADPQGLILVDKIRLRYSGTGKRPVVSQLRAFGVCSLTPISIEIEWGFEPDQHDRVFDGQIQIYNGQLDDIKPLDANAGVSLTGPRQWRSVSAQSGRRGIQAQVLYVANDAQEVKFKPGGDLPTGSTGLLTFHPNRTVVTVRTAAGNFSFAPRDLEAGEPLLVRSMGFFVTRCGSGLSGLPYQRQTAAKGLETIRQRVRHLPEQSIARALADQYTTQRKPYPEPEDNPPMQIDVPDELASTAWRLAFWHVKRRCIKEGDTYLFYIWPYKALLGQESWRIFNALDLLGEHAMTKNGFGPWFKSQGTLVARGLFFDKVGALNVSGWDLNHSQGHGSMLYAMAQHYLLSGDRAWLTEHLPNLKAAAEWIVGQRNLWLDKVGPNSWSAGLIPPCELGDYADWRSLYQTNVFYWRGLKTVATAIADVDPAAGARFWDDAEQYRRAIIKAVDRSILLAPVDKARDGSCRRYIPPQPYLRGLCDQIANPYSAGHAGSLVMDSDCGAAALGLGVLPADDPRLDELLDVLEDRIYLENWMVRMHTAQRQPNNPDAWFTIGAYYYQCGYSQSALAHIFRDDVPNYLRSMFNQYAVDVDPEKGYQFREHPNRTGEGNGGDKTFEVGAFLERMRAMFVMEDADQLWLARATPRAWLEQDKKIAVKNAPSHFGTVAYEIVSNVDHGQISATVTIPARRLPKAVLFRLRHPHAAPIQSVTVDGNPWHAFDQAKEAIRLDGLSGKVTLVAQY
ncbi:MAG: hypothetical protein M1608_17860 [Candidatus Omnitrophica bacterium]|nr:hypothetical protein [Candidatus Omnitrophota bacterium]